MKNIYKQIDGLSQCKVYLYGKMINMRNFSTHDIKSFVAGYVLASANDVNLNDAFKTSREDYRGKKPEIAWNQINWKRGSPQRNDLIV